MSAKTRLIGLIVASAFFMLNLDGSIINTSLPQMAKTFHVQPGDMSLGITVYILTTAAFVPLSGWVADRWGARNVLAAAIVVFTLASLACALSRNLPEFAVGRAVQGVGAALMTPVGRIVVLRSADKSELIEAIALITWPALIAPVIGPALGGFITMYASWRWNFLLNLPLGGVGVALVMMFVPNQRQDVQRPLDWRGFLLSAAALISLMYGLETLSHGAGDWTRSVALILIGAVFSLLSVRHFRRHAQPLLELSALDLQTFNVSSLGAGTLFRAVISATPFLLPLLFQVGFGLTPVGSGLMLLTYFGGNLAMKTVTTPTLRRFGFRRVLVLNGMVVSGSILACALLGPRTPIVFSGFILFLAGVSRSMQFTSLNTLAFADIVPAQRASASTLNGMLAQIGFGLGVAVSALLLHLFQIWRGAAVLGVPDFQFAFLVVGAIGVVASIMCLVLPRDAGAEVSGHGRATA